MAPLQKEMGGLVTWDMEKAEVLNDSFASFFTSKSSTTLPKLQKARAGTGRMKNCSLCEKIRFENI